MGVIAALRGRIGSRYVVVYRVDPRAAAALLPAGARPATVRGSTPVALCYTRLEGARRRWIPRRIDGRSDHLAWRVPVEDEQAGRPVVHVVRRDTSSWWNAHCASVITRGRYHCARFELDEDESSVRLAVTAGGEQVLRFAAVRARDLRGSIFRTTREAEEHLAAAAVVRPPDPLAPALDDLGLRAGRWALEPLEVLELRAAGFEDPETVALDSAFRLTSVRRIGATTLAPLPALEELANPAAT